MRHESDVIIVGGGAAGLMAGIAAAQWGAAVSVIEQQQRVAKKLLNTGNGRCNLSNLAISTAKKPGSVDKRGVNGGAGDGAGSSAGSSAGSGADSGTDSGLAAYSNPEFVSRVVGPYDCQAIRAQFTELGLLTVADERGWVFPRSQHATTVVNVLLTEASRQKLTIYTSEEARNIGRKDGFWQLTTDNATYRGRTAVMACGYSPLLTELQQRLGIKLLPARPVLGPSPTETQDIKGLDGIRASVQLRLLAANGRKLIATEQGELLFRDYGVSGIAVFNLSRFAQPGQYLSIDLFPEIPPAEFKDFLTVQLKLRPGLTASELLGGMLHSRLALALLRLAGIKASEPLNHNMLKIIANTARDFRLKISGHPPASQSQLTRGGLATVGFDPESLQSLQQPGLFAAGECLDVDAPCGGYNLHWAWASGLTAGRAAADWALAAAN